METVPRAPSTDAEAPPAQMLTVSEPMSITAETPARSSQGGASKAMELISDVPKSSASAKTGPLSSDCTIEIDLIGVKLVKKHGAGPHFCPSCQLPIRIYGRLTPCRHSFCWTCAQPPQCAICNETRTTLEKIAFADTTTVFVCNFPKCGRSYTSEYSFQEHQKLRAHHDRAKKEDAPSANTSAMAMAIDSRPKEEPKTGAMAAAVPGGSASMSPVSAEKPGAPEAPRRSLLNITLRPQGGASGAGGVVSGATTSGGPGTSKEPAVHDSMELAGRAVSYKSSARVNSNATK